MADLIDREAAIEALGERPIVWTDDDQYTLGERCQYDIDRLAIETLPSAQPERKVGKWNWDFADNGWADWTCSICGWKKNTDIHVNLGYNYCPNCGARMEGEEDDICRRL